MRCTEKSHNVKRLFHLKCNKNIMNCSAKPIPVATRSNAWVCDRSLAANAGSNPTGGMDVCLL